MTDRQDIAFRFSLAEIEQNRGAIHRRPEATRIEDSQPLPRKIKTSQVTRIAAGVLIAVGLFALFGSSRRRRSSVPH